MAKPYSWQEQHDLLASVPVVPLSDFSEAVHVSDKAHARLLEAASLSDDEREARLRKVLQALDEQRKDAQ